MSFLQPPLKWTWGRELPLYTLYIFLFHYLKPINTIFTKTTMGLCSFVFSLVHCLCIEGACLYTPTDFSRFVLFCTCLLFTFVYLFYIFYIFTVYIFFHNYSTIFTCLIISHSRQGLLAKCKSGDPDKLIVVTFMQSTN